ncbi:DUF7159 family protein [Mycobacterium spongiae]|uniref:DUF7159 domain-containing protein n=1 Tax=Mycobacterium spongiae TaxID=886343 RepID=A0A975PWY3_9MYCO|nr:hypothetical protein [Mycobacterium spongiae]QUR67645.1 hypothetical protein F6B93_11515 [Mycobacterium spongiae]
MDTVLGLSVTPTTVGWVLAEGHSADGAILDHNESHLSGGRGISAVHAAEQTAAEVLRAIEGATAGDDRLRVIGLTWNDEASAQAAVVLESLARAGLDNVVPVRQLDAVETLARAIAPVIGYERTAVCLLDREWATVVMVNTHDGETQSAVKHVRGGYEGLTSWLTGMFDRNAWRPAGVVVVGSDSNINRFSVQLEKVLPVPVFAQTMAQVTVARGAALAAAQRTEFTDTQLLASTSEPTVAPKRSRHYAGAAAVLAAASVTFVGSLSLALGLQLVPEKDPATPRRAVHGSTPRVAEAVTPAMPSSVSATPPAAPQPAPQREPVQPASDSDQIAPDDKPNSMFQQDSTDRAPLLTRVLQHIPGDYRDPASPPPE